MPFIEQLGQQAATQAVTGGLGGIMGLMLQKQQDQRQIRQQEKLQQLQIAGNKELTDYNTAKQLQMWKDTNYKAQMEQLKLAGLNPGLIYGMGGGGGQSTNIAQGQVSGGNAPQGGGEIQSMMGMGIQSALLAAQIKNIEADTKVKEANIPKIGAETKNVQAQEALTRVDTELRQVQASVARQTINDQMNAIENIARKGQAEITALQLKNQLDYSQMTDAILKLRAEAIGAAIENTLKRAQIDKTHAEIDKIANDISLGWENLSNEQQRTRIQEFTAEFQSNHPGLMNVLGGAIQRLADSISKPLKGNKIQ